MKKVLSLILAFIFVVGICASAPVTITANAASVDDLSFELSNDGNSYYVDVCSNEAKGEIIIPSLYNNLPVTRIDWSAFEHCEHITKVVIPNTVTEIGWDAFLNCYSLTSVEIPESVISIYPGAFFGSGIYDNSDNWDNGVFYIDDCLIDTDQSVSGTYTVKNGTRLIAEDAFYGCESLEGIDLPETLKCVRDGAFYGCDELKKIYIKDLKNWCNIYFEDPSSNPLSMGCSLYLNGNLITEVVIPDGTTEIKDYVFCGSNSFTRLYIPDSVKSIGALGDNSLVAIDVSNGNEVYSSEDGVLFNKNKTELITFPCGKESFQYSLPETVTTIAKGAFSGCTWLREVFLPDSLKTIGYGAFSECDGLVRIIFPDNVTSLEDHAFYGCDSLEYIKFGEGMRSIGERVFVFCSSLKEIEINDGLASIGAASFYGCSSLKSVVIPIGLTLENLNRSHFGYTTEGAYWNTPEEKIEGFTIYGVKGSAAETYANENGFTFIEKVTHTHSYTSTVTKQPTCTESGTKTFTCSCGDSYTETIKATGHKWNNGSVTTQPTCTTQGEKTYVCTVCYDAKSELIPANGHKETVVGKKDATENEVGYTGDKVCSLCNKVTEKGKEIPKLGVSLATPVATVKNSATGVKVTWKAIDGAISYKVYRKTYSTKTKKYGSWKTCGTVTTTSYVDTNAKSGTKYIYTVKALNGDVKSGIKNSSSILFLAQPTVKIANASTGVKVSWNKITGATGYKVYRAEYKNGKWSSWKGMKTIDKGSTVSWTDTKVKSGVKYKYTVKAVNGKTGSTYKSSSSLLYLAQPKVAVKALSNGIKVAWVQSTGATSYKIYRSEYNTKTKKWSSWKTIKTAKSTSKSYTDKSAKKGVKYRYTVKAVNGKVASSYKSSSSVKR